MSTRVKFVGKLKRMLYLMLKGQQEEHKAYTKKNGTC